MLNPIFKKAIQQRAVKKLGVKKPTNKQRFLRRPPRQIEPRQIEKSYQSLLSVRIEELQKLVEQQIVDVLPQLIASYKQGLPRADAFNDDVFMFINGVKIAFGRIWSDARTREAARETADKTQRWNKKETDKTYRSVLGVDVFSQEPWLSEQMSNFTEENVGLIKSVDEKYLSEVQEIVFRGARQGRTTKEIAEEIRQRGDVSTSRARLIARDQVSKFYGNLNQIRQTSLGVTRYIWRTAKDERVREEHAAREGDTFEWSNPPDDGHPGEAINCRCYAEPVLEDLGE